MKKQIIAVAAVAVAAILLFTVYTVFFKKDDIEEVSDPFYSLTEEVRAAVSKLEGDYSVTLHGYDVDDDGWVALLRLANDFKSANRDISVETESEKKNGADCVTVSGVGKTADIAYSDMFLRLYDGTRYAFDGESKIANALFSFGGADEMDIAPHAYSGFDPEGDYVTAAGMPFIFKALDRSEVAVLKLSNKTGEYTLYQDGTSGNFYLDSSRVVQFDAEQFSLMTTNCRYPVSFGKMKMPADKTWADYGLETDKPSLGYYSILSVSAPDGSCFMHNVYIGGKSSTGNYYYARYVGGLLDSADGKNSNVLQNLSKDYIYYIPVATVEGSLDSSINRIVSPALVTPLTNTEDILSVQDIRVEYLGDGIKALVKNLSAMTPASNLAVYESSSISKTITDKAYAANDYSAYSGGWKENTSVFGGFTSSDGKDTYIEAALARYSPEGAYSVEIGVLRDEANGAYLPKKITFAASHDGVNYTPVAGEIVPSQGDKTLKRYTASFTSEDRIRFVRLCFDVPQVKYSYCVFDEYRVYAGGDDALPTDSTKGIWRLVSPDEYIPYGRNFAYPDINTYNDMLQSLVALSGDSVVRCGISDNGDAHKLKTEVLAEYGLAEPDRHYAYTFDSATVDVYISLPDENGVYYAYSTVTGEFNGNVVSYTGDIIVALTESNCPWLGWDFFEILDHSLLSMYIVEIEDLTVSFGGEDYKFLLTPNSERNDIVDVAYNGKSFDVKSFKYLYQSILSVYMQDQYTPGEGEIAEEYMRIKIHSETRSPELVFYRVSSTKCYFTIDGEGRYYALVKNVNDVRDNVLKYIAGETITRPR